MGCVENNISDKMAKTFQDFDRVIRSVSSIQFLGSLDNKCIDDVESVIYGGVMNLSRNTVKDIYQQK